MTCATKSHPTSTPNHQTMATIHSTIRTLCASTAYLDDDMVEYIGSLLTDTDGNMDESIESVANILLMEEIANDEDQATVLAKRLHEQIHTVSPDINDGEASARLLGHTVVIQNCACMGCSTCYFYCCSSRA